MIKILLLLLTCLTASAGVAPVLMNSYTTNTQAAADLHVAAVIGGPTNGVTAGTVSNIVSSIVWQNRYTTNADATTINGGNLTNLNTTNLIGTIQTGNLSAFYDPTNAAKNATNLMTSLAYTNPALVVYTAQLTSTSNGIVAQIPSLTGYATLANVQSTNTATLTIATNLAAAVTNGYPWGGLYAPAITSNLNSYTVTFTIPAYATNWTVTLPDSATNYLIMQELFLTPVSANPAGALIPLGGAFPTTSLSGTLYAQTPFSATYQGNGKTFIVAFDGDDANFVDASAQPYRFKGNGTVPSLPGNFRVQSRFTWTIHR